MIIVKVTPKMVHIYKETYMVVTTFTEAEVLFLKHNSSLSIEKMELVAEDVINMWAQ